MGHLGRPVSVGFSPRGGYLAVGQTSGRAALYRFAWREGKYWFQFPIVFSPLMYTKSTPIALATLAFYLGQGAAYNIFRRIQRSS